MLERFYPEVQRRDVRGAALKWFMWRVCENQAPGGRWTVAIPGRTGETITNAVNPFHPSQEIELSLDDAKQLSFLIA
ncbi:unnamed protein product [Hydatigera taeniaeformis]|uniref:RES domain-containing protein n=1 Tax=Hydatigena taeniaeformis TaxID=6205 RepID=A0A0R3WKG6_HYDTA|nr:unnamed protein product [Hydatigera taeniaeformis]